MTLVPRGPLTQEAAETVRISELVKKALDGNLPREREPHYWEPSILTPVHINMVLDRVGGFQIKEIAERWDYTETQVANVLGHPDAQTIMSTVMAIQANTLVDINQRFKDLAPQAVNVKVEIMNDSMISPAVRDRVASDILDRAGYAPRTRAEHEHTHRILLPAQAATGLRDALEASRRVESIDYTPFLQKSDAEVTAGYLQVTEVGHLEPVDGVSPVPASDPSD